MLKLVWLSQEKETLISSATPVSKKLHTLKMKFTSTFYPFPSLFNSKDSPFPLVLVFDVILRHIHRCTPLVGRILNGWGRSHDIHTSYNSVYQQHGHLIMWQRLRKQEFTLTPCMTRYTFTSWRHVRIWQRYFNHNFPIDAKQHSSAAGWQATSWSWQW